LEKQAIDGQLARDRQHLVVFRRITIALLVLLFGTAGELWAQELVEPESVLPFGSTWTYREGTVDSTEWPIRYNGEPGPAEGWFEGPSPFIGRSQAHQDEYNATQRRIRRQRRRRGRSYRPPEFFGTRLIYDQSLYSAPPDAPEDYVPGPNTYLFVTTFDVDDLASVEAMFLEVRFSGGFVAYLNGRELVRHNLNPGHSPDQPADIVWQPSWVRQTVGNVWQRAFTGLPADRLVNGQNTLAFEVHRRGGGGMNALFLDAQVRVYREAGFVKTPYLLQIQPDGVTVSWETSVPGLGYVEYGSIDRLDQVATRPQIQSTLQEVRLRGLLPDMRYFYRVHTDTPNGMLTSPVYHFRTAAGEGTPFTFLLYGDNRTNSATHASMVTQMLERAEQEGARFILNTGDLTTHGGSWDEWQDEFFEPAAPMLSYYPLYPALGNHEGNHETWYEYFDLPNNESWYQFSFGDVDFFALNTSAGMTPESLQYQWLDEALGASEAPWKIAFFHHPAFSCVPTRKPGSPVVADNIVPLLERHGVQLVLLGHDHLYGRSYPINGVTYVISGGGGASTYPAEPDEVNEVCVQVHHYCILRVTEGAIQLDAVTLEGDLLDTFTLTSEPSE